MEQNKIIIRQANRNDEKRIVQKWAIRFKEDFQFKYPHRWKWQFETNPFIDENSREKLPIWIAEFNDEVVGWVCAIYVNTKIDKKNYIIAYGTDLTVEKDVRRQGLGTKLQKIAHEYNPIFNSIQMAEPTRKIKYKLNGKNGKPFFMYYKLIGRLDEQLLQKSIEEYVDYKIKQKSIKNIIIDILNETKIVRIINTIITVLIKAKQTKYYHKEKIKLEYEKVDQFGEEANQLWEKISKRYSFATVRDAKYLNWRYTGLYHLNYEKYLVKNDSKIVGIIIFRVGRKPEMKHGVINEILTFKSDKTLFKEMLAFSEKRLIEKGVVNIKYGTCSKNERKILKKFGYIKSEVFVPVIMIDEKKIDTNYNELMSGKWLISLGDHDIDIPLLNQQPIFTSLVRIIMGKVHGEEYLDGSK